MTAFYRLSLVIIVLSFSASLRAQGFGWDYQEQARTHTTDLQHIEMHISFDEPAKKVMGTVLTTLAILPQKDPVTEIVFDALNLNVQHVWLEERGKKLPLTYNTSDSAKLHITLDRVHPNNVPFTIGIEYWAQPKKGMWFIEPDTFYTERPQQIWTQGEGEENRNWLPTYDYPNDKTTTDMYVTVRADQQALSNGRLMGKEKNKDGTVTWHWNESHPYSTYLIMLGVGHYETPTDTWRGKNVEYWVYPGWSKDAHRIFGLTPDMLEFYSTRTGFPYAWEKYAQIAIADFMYGGMENVSATTLNDYVLFDKRSGIDFSSEGLIAHELAHQWFGDLVTCRSWIEMWLNESFATYFEAMYRQYHDGQDEFGEEMQGDQNAGLETERSQGKKPIIATNGYTANTYSRGAATLNMMRHVLGDTGWWHSIHHYLEVHQYQPVDHHDLKIAIEEATGQNLEWFFDEWLLKSGHPVYDVSYHYDDAAKSVRMSIIQTQVRDSLTGTFKMPIDVELTFPNGETHVTTILDEDSTQTFSIPSPEKPSMVIFDKGNSIIKEVYIHKPPEEWVYQLTHAKEAIERSRAALAMHPDSMGHSDAAFAALKQTASTDPFWAVREHALFTLGYWGDPTHSILDLLVDRVEHDPKPDVRAQAVELFVQLRYPKATVEPVLVHTIETDSSYNVVGTALNALRSYNPDLAYEYALKYLKTSSPRDRMRQNAIGIFQLTKTHASLEEQIALLNQHNIPKWTRNGLLGSISTFVSVDSGLVYRTLWNVEKNNGDPEIRATAANRLADIGNAETLRELQADAWAHPEMKGTYDALLKRMRKRLGVTQ